MLVERSKLHELFSFEILKQMLDAAVVVEVIHFVDKIDGGRDVQFSINKH